MVAKFPALAIASSALLALVACGSDVKPPLAPESIQDLTGLAPPNESVEAQEERGRRIVTNADSLILSSVHVEASLPESPAFVYHAECSGTRCELFEPQTGASQPVDLEDMDFADGPSYTVGGKHGVTLAWSSARIEVVDPVGIVVDHEGYGAWMEHSGFAIQDQAYEVEGISVVERSGLALGDLTGSKPSGGATWLGLMVGTPTTGEHSGDLLQGDAALNYDLESDTLDVGFSGIKNIDRRTSHTTEVVTFTDLTIAPDGTFKIGPAGDRIQGGLYGPGHAEAAGAFDRANIIGAFGAKRQ